VQWLLKEHVFKQGEQNQALQFVRRNGLNGLSLLELTEENIQHQLELESGHKKRLLKSLGKLRESAACVSKRELSNHASL
jgi:hypothetical protein